MYSRVRGVRSGGGARYLWFVTRPQAISRFCSIPWPVRPGSDMPRSCGIALCTSATAVWGQSVRETPVTVQTRTLLRPGAPLFGPGSVAFCRAVPKTSFPHFSPLHQKKGNQSKTSTSDRLPLPPGPSDFPGPARPSYFAARYHPSPPQSLVPFSLSRLVSSRLCPVLSPTSFPFQFPRTALDPLHLARGRNLQIRDPAASGPSLLASPATTHPPLRHH